MKRILKAGLAGIAVAAMLSIALPAAALPPKPQLFVVTSTTDLHDIAHSVGGARTEVIHISEGYQDPHFVEAKPSFVLRLRKA
ncbi:MAG: hypothetical protein H0T21_01065, partial [Gemmatimonadaceae bacterium]|nr:hypothetical protein [Gemmatimonadaceae bacterium]